MDARTLTSLLLTATLAITPSEVLPSPADLSEATAFLDRYVGLSNDLDLQGLQALYADDAVYRDRTKAQERIVAGRPAIDAELAKLVDLWERHGVRFSVMDVQSAVREGQSLVISFRIRAQGKFYGFRFNREGEKLLRIALRNGEWVIVEDVSQKSA